MRSVSDSILALGIPLLIACVNVSAGSQS
jgi:hypothetical protein